MPRAKTGLEYQYPRLSHALRRATKKVRRRALLDACEAAAREVGLRDAESRRALALLESEARGWRAMHARMVRKAAAADDAYLTAQAREDERLEREFERAEAKSAEAVERLRRARMYGLRGQGQLVVDRMASRARALAALAWMLEDTRQGDEEAAYQVLGAGGASDGMERLLLDALQAPRSRRRAK